ncbi:tyrosine-type recombinase/integrase [Nonomuraea sp. B10E15]|uniref:tyrosine-type recombinase/integrase n=1 Tax=Nonomuraea sp. B10E15 TaxID=3153560 RepID=UPI00325F29DA
MHEEYGDLDCDYVFVNLWAAPYGRPLAYRAVYDLVLRLRRRTGLDFDPHWYRHTMATPLPLNRDVPQEVVRRILDHDSPQMTGHYAGCTTPPFGGTGKPPARSTSPGQAVTCSTALVGPPLNS